MKKLLGLVAIFLFLTAGAKANDRSKEANGILDIQIVIYGNNTFIIVKNTIFSYMQGDFIKVYSTPNFKKKYYYHDMQYSEEYSTTISKTVIDGKYYEVVAHDPNPYGGWEFFAGFLKYDEKKNAWIFIPYGIPNAVFSYDCTVAYVEQLGQIAEWSKDKETGEYVLHLSGNAIVSFDPINDVFTDCFMIDTCCGYDEPPKIKKSLKVKNPLKK